MRELRIALAAARDLLCLAGAVALGSFFAVERSGWWLLPTSAILAVAGWALYRIEAWRAGRRGQALARLARSERRAARAAQSLEREAQALPALPRPDQKRWLLTENEIPVGIETNQRAAENWMGLGEAFDAVAFEPPAWRERKLALRRARRARDRRAGQRDAYDEEHAR